MAVLISSVADLLHDPGGLWELLILKVFKFIGNYGWRILFFTVCLKLLLFPLDLYQRIKMRKNQLITERIKPQMEKLQQQYAGDRQALAQKQMELNKKEGFSYFSSCLPMIVTLVIFFYLFAGLNNISQYKNFRQYVELYDAYTAVETAERAKPIAVEGYEQYDSYDALVDARKLWDGERPSDEAYKENGAWVEGGENAYRESAAYQTWSAKAEALRTADLNRDAEIKKLSQAAVVKTYGKRREGFLWVSNIWSPDVPWRDSILSYNQFKSNVGSYAKYKEVISKLDVKKTKLTAAQFQQMMSSTTYNKVTRVLYKSSTHNHANGYLILPILSVALSFLSQFITTRLQKKSGQLNDPTGNSGCSMKAMMFVMPIMMGIFALNYTSMFTLYIVVNSAMSILINVFTSLAINGKSKRTEKTKTTGVQKYGRPDPKDL